MVQWLQWAYFFPEHVFIGVKSGRTRQRVGSRSVHLQAEDPQDPVGMRHQVAGQVHHLHDPDRPAEHEELQLWWRVRRDPHPVSEGLPQEFQVGGGQVLG